MNVFQLELKSHVLIPSEGYNKWHKKTNTERERERQREKEGEFEWKTFGGMVI